MTQINSICVFCGSRPGVRPAYRAAAEAVGALLAFVSGAAVTAILVNWALQQRLHSSYALVLLIEALLMLVFGLVGAVTLDWRTPFAVPVTVLLRRAYAAEQIWMSLLVRAAGVGLGLPSIIGFTCATDV